MFCIDDFNWIFYQLLWNLRGKNEQNCDPADDEQFSAVGIYVTEDVCSVEGCLIKMCTDYEC